MTARNAAIVPLDLQTAFYANSSWPRMPLWLLSPKYGAILRRSVVSKLCLKWSSDMRHVTEPPVTASILRIVRGITVR